MARQFIITGCSRSGTTYMAQLLGRLGIPVEHERYFPTLHSFGNHLHLNRRARPWVQVGRIDWSPPPLGEVAWQAAPILHRLSRDVVVFHQVRHPFAFAASRMKKGLPYLPLCRRHTSFEWPCDSAREFATLPEERQFGVLLEFWMEWNRLVEDRAPGAYCYRIEDVDADDVRTILDRINVQVSVDELATAMAEVPKDIHSLGATRAPLTFEELPLDFRERLSCAAGRYGYSLP